MVRLPFSFFFRFPFAFTLLESPPQVIFVFYVSRHRSSYLTEESSQFASFLSFFLYSFSHTHPLCVLPPVDLLFFARLLGQAILLPPPILVVQKGAISSSRVSRSSCLVFLSLFSAPRNSFCDRNSPPWELIMAPCSPEELKSFTGYFCSVRPLAFFCFLDVTATVVLLS